MMSVLAVELSLYILNHLLSQSNSLAISWGRRSLGLEIGFESVLIAGALNLMHCYCCLFSIELTESWVTAAIVILWPSMCASNGISRYRRRLKLVLSSFSLLNKKLRVGLTILELTDVITPLNHFL